MSNKDSDENDPTAISHLCLPSVRDEKAKSTLALLQETQTSLPLSSLPFVERLPRVLMALRGRTGRIHHRPDWDF